MMIKIMEEKMTIVPIVCPVYHHVQGKRDGKIVKCLMCGEKVPAGRIKEGKND